MDPDTDSVPVGSASFCQIFSDPDPQSDSESDPDPFQPNVKLKYTVLFSRKFLCDIHIVQLENYNTFFADEKDLTIKTGNAENKSKKNSDFPKSRCTNCM